MSVMNRSNRPLLIIGLVVVVVLFLYFGGGARMSSMTGGKMLGSGPATGFGGGWMPIIVALAVGIGIGWAIFRRR
jgi:hypothetical protein